MSTPRGERRPWWNALAAGVIGIAAGAVLLLKLILGKLVFIAVVWAGIAWAARVGGWVGIVLIVAIVIGAIAYGKAHIT
jgi:hypothetical protein